MRKAWVFVLVLAHSRRMVVRIVFDQRVETWLRLHIEAFEELRGVPEVVVPDNLKAAVVKAGFGVGGATALNRSYRELARHYCVLRSKPNTYSGRNRTVIPEHAEHPFRTKANTDSGASRTLNG